MKATDRALGLAMLSCHGGLGLTDWLRRPSPTAARGDLGAETAKPARQMLEDSGRIGARKG